MAQTLFYCTECGQEDRFSTAYCTACGRARKLTARARTAGVAFLLNEIQASPASSLLSEPERQALSSHYRQELVRLTGRPLERTAPAPQRQPAPAPAAPGIAPNAPYGVMIQPRHQPARPRVTIAPRPPHDWSWLAEQQANLFLFAGAFLTVVAALIYVAYSGQRVDGTLKMMLLVVYTLAFIAAGIVCLRYPRVRMAGHVFFAIGAILVPLNFVVAKNILHGNDDLSPESLWLSGSIVTALFYTSVARIGLGRWYAFAAGASVISAATAAFVVADAPPEWALAMFVAVAIAMSLPKLLGDAPWRDRVGTAWAIEADVLALAAIVVAVFFAPYPRIDDLDLDVSLWFLPAAFALFCIHAAIQTTVLKREEAGVALLAGIAGLAASVVYVFELPGEWYTVAFAAVAPPFGVAQVALDRDGRRDLVPARFIQYLRYAAIAATCFAAAIGLLYAFTTLGTDPHALNTRWFLLPAFLLILAFYAIDGFVRREQGGLSGCAFALTGACAAVVFGLHAAPEYYAFAFIAAGAAMLVFAHAEHLIPSRFLRDDARQHAAGYALAAIGAGMSIALAATLSQASEDSTYQLQTNWFVTAAFATAAAAVCLYMTLRMPVLGDSDRLAHYGLAAAIAAAASGVVFALDASPQYYAAAFLAAAALTLVIEVVALPAFGDADWRHEDALISAHISALIAGALGIGSALSEAGFLGTPPADPGVHTAAMRSLLPALFAALAAFYVAAALIRTPGWPDAARAASTGFVASVFGVASGIVYATHAGAEYYSFALLVPAVALALATRATVPARIASLLPDDWRDDAFLAGRAAALSGIAVALACVFAAAQPVATYAPQTQAFLPIAFAVASMFWTLDAMRGRRTETSVALAVSVIGVIVTIPYAAQAGPAWYGLAFVAAGIALGLAGRAWSPSWFDARVRDAAAALSVTLGWLAFEGAYIDDNRLGAVAHLLAAAFYAAAAWLDHSQLSLNRALELHTTTPVRVASGWLYAAAFTGTVGYLYALNLVPGPENTQDLATLPIFALAAGLAALAASTRYWRAEFRPHLYVISLLLAAFSLAVPATAFSTAAILTAYAAIYALAAAWERWPVLAAPAALFGLAAVPAWRVYFDAPDWTIVAAYTGIAMVLVTLASALWARHAGWARAIAAAAAAYAIAAPAAGFAMLAATTTKGYADGVPFERTALYGWSTFALAIVGVLTVAVALAERRRWLIAPASLLMCVALLLGIGHFGPGNLQAYTLVIGVYLMLFGLLLMWKYEVAGGLSEFAPYVEALGAVIVMGPSFLQSFPSTWQYEMVVVIEATLFFAGGVILRRRGLIGAATLFLVAVAARSMFDAVNALPNWVVVMLAGMALLGIGVGILLGRDRWNAWQQRLLSWWDETGATLPPNGHGVS